MSNIGRHNVGSLTTGRIQCAVENESNVPRAAEPEKQEGPNHQTVILMAVLQSFSPYGGWQNTLKDVRQPEQYKMKKLLNMMGYLDKDKSIRGYKLTALGEDTLMQAMGKR